MVWDALSPVFCVLHLGRCSCVLFGAWLVSWPLPKPHLMPSYGYLENLTWKVHVYFPSSSKVLFSSEDLQYLREEQKPEKAVEFSLANNQIAIQDTEFKLMLHSSFLSLQLIKMQQRTNRMGSTTSCWAISLSCKQHLCSSTECSASSSSKPSGRDVTLSRPVGKNDTGARK